MMGINSACFSKEPEKEDITTLVKPPDGAKALGSLTLPSLCEAPSFHLSVKASESAATSETFSWSRIQSVTLQPESVPGLPGEHLTMSILQVAAQVFEVVKRHIGNICDDLQTGTLKMHESVVDSFARQMGAKPQNPTQLQIITKRIIVHFVTLVYVHDVILNYFRDDNEGLALDFLRQIAVSHALKGLMPSDFRMMDWFIIRYLLKTKLIGDESINNLMIYLTIISNYIASFYEAQSVRKSMMENLLTGTEKDNDRGNKARENYRLLKKWKKQNESFKDQDKFVDELLANFRLPQKEEDEKTIDTEVLKENDCLMKHFVKKKKED